MKVLCDFGANLARRDIFGAMPVGLLLIVCRKERMGAQEHHVWYSSHKIVVRFMMRDAREVSTAVRYGRDAIVST